MKKRFLSLFPFSGRDCLVTLLLLTIATLVSFALALLPINDMGTPTLFVLTVFLIARYTNGYLFGTIASLISVVLVNFIFTYPYFEFNFTLSGYPLTFLVMFATSCMTSALTTRIKRQEQIHLESEKEKMRGNLLRAVSHDLRTPLTSIVGTTSALLENGDKLTVEQQRELIRESRDDAEWLIRMVENLLSITRMNGGEAQITKTPEVVEEIVGETVCKFNKRFPNIQIDVSVPDELLFVPMDAILIEQLLINLLENAVLHGKNPNGIALHVRLQDSQAIFEVIDCGVGIAESVFPRLFDGAFPGQDESESDRKRNMGVGLSVCMSIVRAHGGQMCAENRTQGGALFRFSLPVNDERRDT